MPTEPRIPDFFVPITGWRAWKVPIGTTELRGTGQGSLWQPGKPTEANCVRLGAMGGLKWTKANQDHSREPLPISACACGVYAMKTLEQVLHHNSLNFAYIYGRVALWGKVIEHQEGWRAQYGYPIEFLNRRTESTLAPDLSAIAALYKVKVIEMTEEQKQLFKEIEIDAEAGNQAALSYNGIPLSAMNPFWRSQPTFQYINWPTTTVSSLLSPTASQYQQRLNILAKLQNDREKSLSLIDPSTPFDPMKHLNAALAATDDLRTQQERIDKGAEKAMLDLLERKPGLLTKILSLVKSSGQKDPP